MVVIVLPHCKEIFFNPKLISLMTIFYITNEFN